MPTISKEKKERISEQILQYLFQSFPKQMFTSDIAREIARDEEFIKVILIDLEKKGLTVRITKNQEGTDYIRRLRWRLSNKAHEIYSMQIKAKAPQVQQKVEENLDKISESQ
jgi:predicted transcriptional regulator with HTH domain